jgi:peptide/nickel transport system substrate-binding protein
MGLTRRTTFKLFGGALAGTLAAGRSTPSHAQTRPVVVALEEIPRRLDPLRVQLNPGYRVMHNIYDTLIAVDYKAGGKLVPALATAWRRIDPKTLELTLRDGVVFHDGSPLTTDDVVFTFSEGRISKPDSPGYPTAQQHLSTIAGAEATGPKTIRVMTKTPDPVLELRLSAWGSQIISKAAFEKAGGWEGYSQKPMGTGPFSLERMTTDEIRLQAFPKYWGGVPTITTLVYRPAVELSARIAGLATGDFDLISDVPPDQFAAVSRVKDLEVVGGPIASLRVVKFDTRNPDLKDARVRQALGLAVNYEAITKSLWHGLLDVPRGHQLQSFGDLYDPNRPKPAYNPQKAKELLAAAGYKGRPIPYRIRPDAYAAEVATAQILISMWKQVGVNIDLQIKENFGQLLAYPGTGMRNGVDPVLVNDPLFSLWRSYNQSERDVWSNEEFYRLGAILESAMDPAERKKALTGMLDIFDNDPPAIILHTTGLFYGKRKNLNWTPYPHAYMDFRRDNASLGAG